MSDFMFNLIIATSFAVAIVGLWLIAAAVSVVDDFEIKGCFGKRKSFFQKVIEGFKEIFNA